MPPVTESEVLYQLSSLDIFAAAGVYDIHVKNSKKIQKDIRTISQHQYIRHFVKATIHIPLVMQK